MIKEQEKLQVGFNKESEAKELREATNKLKVLNEATALASKILNKEINVKGFVELGFINYIFQAMLLSEPIEKRSQIDKQSYFQLYSVPSEVLSSLQSKYDSTGQDLILSDCGTKFLLKDHNEYLTDSKHIELYKACEKLIRLYETSFKDCGLQQAELIMSFRNLIIRNKDNGKLTPGVSQIKRINL